MRGSLEAAPTVYVTAEQAEALDGLDLAEIAIVSGVDLKVEPPPPEAFTLPEVKGCGVLPIKTDAARCERCWQHLPDVGGDPEHPDACARCADAVRQVAEAA